MKKNIIIIAIIILGSALFAACARHLSPAAVIDPVVTGSVTVVLTPGYTATITNTVPPGSTATSTNTATQTVSTPTSTPSHTAGRRLKTLNVYQNSILATDTVFTYGAASYITPAAMVQNIYDSAGNVSQTVQATFDASGNTISLTSTSPINPGTPSSYQTSEYTNGRLTKLSTYNMSNNLLQYTTFQYDAAGRKTVENTYNPSNVLVAGYAYTYNAAGNPTRIDTTGVSTGYTLFTYNATGNPTRVDSYTGGVLQSYVIYTYNAAGKPTSLNTYDGAGNLQMSMVLTYNAANNPVTYTQTMYGTFNVVQSATYTYDSYDMPVQVDITQTMMGVPMMTMRTTMTYESY